MIKTGTCRTCDWFGKPASDDGVKYRAGGCGNRKIQHVRKLEDAQVELDDRLIYSGHILKVGLNFGCIHYK